MSDKQNPTSIKLDEEIEAALAEVLARTKLKKHAVLVAAVREGLRVFLLDAEGKRLNAAHAKETLPLSPTVSVQK